MKFKSRKVTIAREKIKNYLLIPKKRNDKSKWLAQAGYKMENSEILENDLRNQILILDATPIEETKYGQMYEIRGSLKGPNGKTLSVCTIWMTEYDSSTKFITMFPGQKE